MTTCSFSPIADFVVELVAAPDHHLFLVSSEILRVVSPVWRKELDPNSKFAPLEKVAVGGTEYRKKTFSGISSHSLTNVFNIFHNQASSTPRSISFSSLRDIAILADQYDFAKALAPWPQFWIESLIANVPWYVDPGHGYEDWLFIATVFKDVPTCKQVIVDFSKQLIFDLIVCPPRGSDGDVSREYSRWDPGAQRQVEVNLELVPEKILEFMRKERDDRLSKVLLPIWIFTQDMMNLSFHYPNSEETLYCKNPDCFALALGSLLRSINDGGLQSFLMAKQFKIPEGFSLQEIAEMVQVLEITTLILERKATYTDFRSRMVGINPTHGTRRLPTPKAVKSLVADLPEEIFLRDQYESITKHTDGRFQTCPLARHFALQQQNITTILGEVVGYTEVSS
ncbi:hypothetical protein TWF192_008502 [Orbilia oligospora]|uniref:Uncharacterized protein n=1 Tax=Orbilia oligospora TaxID=2813651 RepID=A0A6G1M3K7_ORBOL|nr:hypothetical protein TWF679_010436 [Orbilia oligospora]KAF3242785.1 hypothetical protein TWF192_008502 [Orbilia oligospora]